MLHEEPRELSRKLSRFVQGSGRLFITIDSLSSLGADGIAVSAAAAAGGSGVLTGGCCRRTAHAAGTVVDMAEDGERVVETHGFTSYEVALSPGATTLARTGASVLAAEVPVPALPPGAGRRGSVVLLTVSGHGVSDDVVRVRRNPCRHTFGLRDETWDTMRLVSFWSTRDGCYIDRPAPPHSSTSAQSSRGR